jgi:D-sedoheptulose 7-phosphate isomerase
MTLSTMQYTKLLQQAEGQFKDSIVLKEQILQGNYLKTLLTMAEKVVEAIQGGGKLMLCGNGGSAADAQHLAAELLVRLRSDVNRSSIPAIALAMDTSTITACANDYSFDYLYQRMIEGLGREGDVLLGITTSGRSKNIISALKVAREKGITTLGFLGNEGGEANLHCDFSFIVPSNETDRIQEVHITAGHILMEFIEDIFLAA